MLIGSKQFNLWLQKRKERKELAKIEKKQDLTNAAKKLIANEISLPESAVLRVIKTLPPNDGKETQFPRLLVKNEAVRIMNEALKINEKFPPDDRKENQVKRIEDQIFDKIRLQSDFKKDKEDIAKKLIASGRPENEVLKFLEKFPNEISEETLNKLRSTPEQIEVKRIEDQIFDKIRLQSDFKKDKEDIAKKLIASGRPENEVLK
ncbi:hypothetical protein MZM54_05520, partial [[Brevibacterium] frigoritolerans]|nr:hypothetical protein [Peribacillus frigoritolerans]